MSLTSKGLLDIDHFPRTGLHEAASFTPRILQSLSTTHNPGLFQIALISRHYLHRLHRPGILPSITFYIYHLHEVVKSVERRNVRYVVDEKEGIGLEV